LLAVVIDLTTLASMISFGALVAFSAVNLAVIRSYLLLDGRRAPRDLLRYGLVPAIGLGLTLLVLFPFTRLVHIVSAPVWYLGRRYQIVRQKRPA
ncbi:respiratory nitrate reductase subunit gamma, partial [Acinetobacter baumannii]